MTHWLVVLPEGFTLPSPAYSAALLLAALIVAVLLVLLRPEVQDWTVLAFGSWMGVGAALHVLERVGAVPDWAAPLFAAPAVYVSTFILTGGVWLFLVVGQDAGFFASVERLMGLIGGSIWIVLTIFISVVAIERGTFSPLWPVMALVASLLVGGLAYLGLSLTYTTVVARTGKVGGFVVIAHSLDGVTTAVGVDVLGTTERSPVPRMVLEFAEGLPTAEVIGVGWLFVVVKVVLALAIVGLFADFVEANPDRANILFTAIAAVGFGPGVYNLLLYLVTVTPT